YFLFSALIRCYIIISQRFCATDSIRKPYPYFCFSLYSTVMVRAAVFKNSVANDVVRSATGGSI
ncbi:MAG: hypothetical protein PHG52_06870, partial [Synergistaceae bacterium]|nr:hypothetical protein [Synergistaceae bacterium]